MRTEQFCSESRQYLEEIQSSLQEEMPAEINLNALTPDELNHLIELEETAKTNYQEQLQQAQNKAKKLRIWTIGVALSTIVLLSAAALLVLFFPPAAVIIPFFAAIGPWSPLLVLTSLLPSVGLGIASLVALRNGYKIQNKLNQSQNVLDQLVKTRDPIPSTSGQTMSHHTSIESLTSQTSVSNELSNGERTRYGSAFSTNQTDSANLSNNEEQQALPRTLSSPSLIS